MGYSNMAIVDAAQTVAIIGLSLMVFVMWYQVHRLRMGVRHLCAHAKSIQEIIDVLVVLRGHTKSDLS